MVLVKELFSYYLNSCNDLSAETEFEDGIITPYSNPPELPDVMKAPESSATATD